MLSFAYALVQISLYYSGQVISPSDGSRLYVFNGSNEKIEWLLDPSKTFNARSWSFESSHGGNEYLGSISRTGDIDVATKLYDVGIEEPATLLLNNVNASYDGIYKFAFSTTTPGVSKVVVIVPGGF